LLPLGTLNDFVFDAAMYQGSPLTNEKMDDQTSRQQAYNYRGHFDAVPSVFLVACQRRKWLSSGLCSSFL